MDDLAALCLRRHPDLGVRRGPSHLDRRHHLRLLHLGHAGLWQPCAERARRDYGTRPLAHRRLPRRGQQPPERLEAARERAAAARAGAADERWGRGRGRRREDAVRRGRLRRSRRKCPRRHPELPGGWPLQRQPHGAHAVLPAGLQLDRHRRLHGPHLGSAGLPALARVGHLGSGAGLLRALLLAHSALLPPARPPLLRRGAAGLPDGHVLGHGELQRHVRDRLPRPDDRLPVDAVLPRPQRVVGNPVLQGDQGGAADPALRPRVRGHHRRRRA
mmetsp:Transcript_98878/g.308105  ORF Transcript_98878/g.308105 Transcript_98878/m.308105 type:complete len:274 (-) Transcript_98878:82-903(-)